jgi:hypothetical protein
VESYLHSPSMPSWRGAQYCEGSEIKLLQWARNVARVGVKEIRKEF